VEEVPCNLTQIVSDTLGGTSSSGETITTFYESAQLDNGKPNTPSSSNTFSNSIPCVFNYPFVMGNQFRSVFFGTTTFCLKAIKYLLCHVP
jgi:hypothetical protein